MQWASEADIPGVSTGTGSSRYIDSAPGSKTGNMRIQDIYLSLLKILLSPPTENTPLSFDKQVDIMKAVPSSSTGAPKLLDPDRLKVVVDAAERHCDKIDPCAFLNLLPKNVPVASIVNFVCLSMESSTANQHNLQVANVKGNNIHIKTVKRVFVLCRSFINSSVCGRSTFELRTRMCKYVVCEDR